MIKIFYDRQARRLTVSGHAGSAPKGQDLVCAAVTALVLNLAENLRAMEQQGYVSQMHLDIGDGYADLSCTPAAGYEALVDTVYQACLISFPQLAEAHPESVAVYGLEIPGGAAV